MSIFSGVKNTCSFAVLRDLSGAIILRIKMQKLPLASLNKNWQDFFLHISGESGLNVWSVVNPRFQTFVNWHLNVWFKWEYFTHAGPVWLAWLYMLRGNALKRFCPLKFFIFSLLSITGKQVNKLQEKIWFLPAQSFLRRFKDKKMNQREQFIGLKSEKRILILPLSDVINCNCGKSKYTVLRLLKFSWVCRLRKY